MNRAQPDAGTPAFRGPVRRSVVRWMPLVVFAGMVALFGKGLVLDPRLIPSPLIGKPIPVFDLPPVQGRTLELANTDLGGEVVLVNVFASWCVACRAEHPLLVQLQRDGYAPIHGLNYKDRPEDAAAWLESLGDPYTRTGADTTGRVGIDWGVYGVPETFVIDRRGHAAYKHIGPITEAAWRETFEPLIERLRQ